MVGRRAGECSEPMIDVTYRQSATQREVVAVLQKIYLCASMDFLMAVSDFFVQAMPQSAIQLPVTSHADKLPLKHMPEHRITAQTGNTTLSVPSTLVEGWRVYGGIDREVVDLAVDH